MNRVQLIANTIFFTICVFLAPKTFAEPPNLALITNEVINYHDSGAYCKELTNTINNAKRYIVARAKANLANPHQEKLAIILDIDETSLSNYKYMYKRHFLATKKQLLHEIWQADAPAIQPTLSLYKTAKKLNIDIFFITGRRESEAKPTILNLQKTGFSDWSGIYFKPNNYNKSSAIPFKAKIRSEISKNGYKIIASIGDQCSDIQGGYVEKGFKLPNPYYYLP